MYRNQSQRGRLSVFFSVGSKPFNNWKVYTKDGYITRFLDPDIKSMVVELRGINVSTTYMVCPSGKVVLGIAMPFLVMIVKNLKKYFSFEVTILDDTGARRRFRVSNFQSFTQVLPLCTVMPIDLSDGWNQIQFNLFEFTRRAYNKQFVEVQNLKINCNIRLRRIYFTDRLVPDEELPPEYKIFFPFPTKSKKYQPSLMPKENKDVDGDKENVKPSTSKQIQIIEKDPLKVIKSSKDNILKENSNRSIRSKKSSQKIIKTQSSRIGTEDSPSKLEEEKGTNTLEKAVSLIEINLEETTNIAENASIVIEINEQTSTIFKEGTKTPSASGSPVKEESKTDNKLSVDHSSLIQVPPTTPTDNVTDGMRESQSTMTEK